MNSELTNALNPHARPRQSNGSSAYPTPALQPAQPYVPHRSELELAISGPAPTRSVPSVQELVALEMERQMLEMRNEISTLRSLVYANHSPLFTPYNGSPAMANLRYPRPASPISPVSQPSSHSQHFSEAPSSVSRPRKRRRRSAPLSDDESASDSSSSSRPARRTDHHDKRILTVQRAMRAHILLSMDLANDKALPDSHAEGEPLDPLAPVRFVWDKTSKQSAHNGRMKLQVVEDFHARRRLYKHVPDKEFGKKVVDSAFEQSFTTFRQKFKAQRDAIAASRARQREDVKARKARHLGRRKTKLSNRADARLKLDRFEHVIFDGAMQVECMSSEESDFDTDHENPRGSGPLRTRGYEWRSSRLRRFYAVLDDEDTADASLRPKRGVGRRERFTGPPKDGFYLPPKGVASWMVSRRWLFAAQGVYPDLGDALKELVFDAAGADWTRLVELGAETDEEGDLRGQQYYEPA
ncbi:hypothetical protein C8R46DRAFT_1072102 [Mycena filopes]|nr:hypothetical protein C8R46DRAFT_1072102 [Mycena filopes]